MRAEIAPAILLAIESVIELGQLEVSDGDADDFSSATGLEPADLQSLAPWAPSLGAGVRGSTRHVPCDDEMALRALLEAACVAPAPFATLLPAIVARRSMREDHLWQDLGLPHRAALSQLMAVAFPSLYAANDRDMKWKRFFYRSLCEAEGFSLCAVPHCRDCSDFERCFGSEDGQSAFARRARADEAVP
jgi:nitrogen fixation protein NifQ